MSGSDNGHQSYGLSALASFSASPDNVPMPQGSAGTKATDAQVVIKP
jgi:hypothetical protein